MSEKHAAKREAKLQKRFLASSDKASRERVERRSKIGRGWVALTCRALCGCCEAELWYSSKDRAEIAAKSMAMKHAELTDDVGETVMVDGFFPFALRDFE